GRAMMLSSLRLTGWLGLGGASASVLREPEGVEHGIDGAWDAQPLQLAHRDDLARMAPAFERTLSADFDLAALSGRLCPVLLEDGSAALFMLADYVGSAVAAELARMLTRRGHRLAARPVCVLP